MAENSISNNYILNCISKEILKIPISDCLFQADEEFKKISNDLFKFEKMKVTLMNLKKLKCFEKKEIEDYEKNIIELSKSYVKQIEKINNLINTAKEIWEEKKKIMTIMWEDNILEKDIIEKWKIYMTEYENEIIRLDSQIIQFCDNKK